MDHNVTLLKGRSKSTEEAEIDVTQLTKLPLTSLTNPEAGSSSTAVIPRVPMTAE